MGLHADSVSTHTDECLIHSGGGAVAYKLIQILVHVFKDEVEYLFIVVTTLGRLDIQQPVPRIYKLFVNTTTTLTKIFDDGKTCKHLLALKKPIQ